MRTPFRPRHGSCLEHGTAHDSDHRRWTRRDFLMGLGAAAAGTSLLLGDTPVTAFARSPLLSRLAALETDRVLVLIQLNGGNDGLNTVVPVEDDAYYTLRPSLAIPKSATVPLTHEVGLHGSMQTLESLYGDGRMALLQNVGYAAPNLSHFRATDIWLSASEADEYDTTGWAGRMLDAEYPDFSDSPTPYPLAVQIGGGSSLLFQGPETGMGMSLISTELFDRIVEDGNLYDVNTAPSTTYGDEIAFLRTIANNSFRYAGVIQEAADGVENDVEYPAANTLAANLAIVARLIKGRLGARIYLVSLGGFDTHANQANVHASLLQDLADAVKAFHDDLNATNMAGDALVMTFSEFGRRVAQNGSGGTDHGTAAPLFLFGGGVRGGIYGHAPRLDDLDQTGNLKYDIDFRSVYATILADWFGLEPAVVETVLGGSFGSLEFVADPAPTGADNTGLPTTFALHQNYPNPFNPQTVIPYTLREPSHVRMDVFDVQGRRIRTLADGHHSAGDYRVAFSAGSLPSGTYVYRLTTPTASTTRTMTLVR